MTKRYEVFIEPKLHMGRKQLPGYARSWVRQTIDLLATQPRPSDSKPLDTSDLEVPAGIELRRIRHQGWRLIYAVNDDEQWVWLWGVKRRPPYNYQDLPNFVQRLQ